MRKLPPLRPSPLSLAVCSAMLGLAASAPVHAFSFDLNEEVSGSLDITVGYANMYRADNLTGGHIIMLGEGNEKAATNALSAWPGGMQVGGGITNNNAQSWLDRGASAVIVTSYVFNNGIVHEERLKELVQLTGKNNLVLDLSCRKKDGRYFVVDYQGDMGVDEADSDLERVVADWYQRVSPKTPRPDHHQ